MYKKTIKRGEKFDFDYYIYVDYSENLVGYMIIENSRIKEIIPKISRFRHYRESKNRRIYLKHIHNTIKREKICSYLLEFKIKKICENLEIYTSVLDFIKKHDNCIIFVSIDNKQYFKFKKLIYILNDKKIKIVKESELRKNTVEYQMSLIIDNLLNVKRIEMSK